MVQVARRRITVEQYQRMGEAGIIGPNERVELIDGELVEMSPVGPPHAMTVWRWMRALTLSVSNDGFVWVQNPVVTDDHSEPQPDLAVLRAKPEEYWEALPRPEDTLLVVEVSDSSLAYDRRTKARLYARSGIPQLVITDLVHNRVESHTDPGPDGYRTVRTLRRGDSLALASFPGRTIPLSSILREAP